MIVISQFISKLPFPANVKAKLGGTSLVITKSNAKKNPKKPKKEALTGSEV